MPSNAGLGQRIAAVIHKVKNSGSQRFNPCREAHASRCAGDERHFASEVQLIVHSDILQIVPFLTFRVVSMG